MTDDASTPRHAVTVEHLRHLATVDKKSLFADATALIETEDGITRVPLSVVTAALEGHTRLTRCRLLYDRSQFIEDGIVIGASPATIDGTDLDTRLASIAAGLTEILAETT